MDYTKSAREILAAAGGKENIISAAHCATRLRLVIADCAKTDKQALENAEGVKGVFEASGQLQVIIGTGAVNKVFEEFSKLTGIQGSSSEDVKAAAVSNMPWYRRAVKTLGDIFVPIIPAIVASGLLMGLLEGFANLYPSVADSGTYTVFHLFSNAAFVYLPVLIAISAAGVFGGNRFLGAVIGMIMIHPDLLSAWAVAGAESIPTASVWFGLYDINLVGYQGHVIPVVAAVWFMSFIEKRLHKAVPEMIDLFVTPLTTVLVTGYLTLTVFGPVLSFLENSVLSLVQMLISVPYGIGAALCGAVYAPTVVAGIHHMYNALEAGLISSTDFNTWMPIATAANIAQGAAALAFAIKTRSRKNKAVAYPSALSAFLGITEPAIFGVNLRFLKPFIAGCVGGAVGGAIAGWLGVSATAYGITGVFGFLITTHNLWQYLLVMTASFVSAFAVCIGLYSEKEQTESKSKTASVATLINAPLSGRLVSLASVPDDTFSSGVLGNGIAIAPDGNAVYAPADCVVSTLFGTHHAVGVTLDSGEELLIHIGINTVELDGKGFKAFVKTGDRVKKGQKLLEFDRELIESRGYDSITPVIVTDGNQKGILNMLADAYATIGSPLYELGGQAP